MEGYVFSSGETFAPIEDLDGKIDPYNSNVFKSNEILKNRAREKNFKDQQNFNSQFFKLRSTNNNKVSGMFTENTPDLFSNHARIGEAFQSSTTTSNEPAAYEPNNNSSKFSDAFNAYFPFAGDVVLDKPGMLVTANALVNSPELQNTLLSRGNMAPEESIRQDTLERYTGTSNNPEWRTKRETEPLFKPTMGITNIFGMSAQTDELRKHYIPSSQMRGVPLMQPIQVGPGLGLKANEAATGLNQFYRVMPRTIDETRVLSKQKVTNKTQINQGKAPVNFRASLGTVIKKKPEKYFATNEKDYIRGQKYYIGAQPVNTYVNKSRGLRENKTHSLGAVKGQSVGFDPSMTNFTNYTKEAFQADPRNVKVMGGINPGADSYTVTLNDKKASAMNRAGPAGIRNGGSMIHNSDYVSKNKADERGHSWIGPAVQKSTGHVYQNAPSVRQNRKTVVVQPHLTGFSGQNMGHIVDPRDVGKINHNKSMSVSHAGMGGNFRRGPVYDVLDVPSQQQKNSYVENRNGNIKTVAQGFVQDFRDIPTFNANKSQNTRMGGFQTSATHGPTFDPSNVPKYSKSILVNKGPTGFKSNNSYGVVRDPYDTPNVRNKSDYSYQIAGASYNSEGYVLDPFDNVKPTQKGREASITGQRAHSLGAVWNPQDVNNVTKKDQFNCTRAGNFGGSIRHSPVNDPNNVTKQTNRGTYNNQNLGPIKGNRYEGVIFDPHNTTRVTQKGNSQNMVGFKTHGQGPVWDNNDKTFTTKREMISKDIVGSADYKKQGVVIDFRDVPRNKQLSDANLDTIGFSGYTHGYVIDPSNIPKVLQKENPQMMGPMQSSIHAPHVFDANDVPNLTRKNTNNSTPLMGASKTNYGSHVYNFNDTTKITRKNQKSNSHTGQIKGPSQSTVYDPYDKPRQTKKMHQNNAAGLGMKAANKSYVLDPNDQPHYTKKGFTNDYRAPISSKTGQYLVDPTDLPKQLRKKGIEDTSSSSMRISNAKTKDYVRDPLFEAKRTKREQYELEKRIGPVSAGNRGVPLTDKIPLKTTRKDTTLIKNRVGNASQQLYGEILREQYNNANLSDVKTSPGRVPSLEGVKETPSNVFGTTQFKSKRKHAVTQVNSGYIDSGNFVLPNIYAI